jgi:nicotinamide mononucleotide transporter
MTPAEINAQSLAAAEMWRLNDLRIRAEAARMKSWQINQSLIAAALGVVLTALSYGIAYMVGWDVQFSWLDALAVGTSYACTWLCVVQSRFNYPVGIVSVALYSYIFWAAGFVALAAFNLYLVGSLIYGWFRWGRDSKPKLVTSLRFDRWTLGYVAIGLAVAGVCMLINMLAPGTFGTLDIALAALSGVAQLLLDNKRLQTWAVWLVVNLLSMYAFYYAGMYIVLLQYVFFTANTLVGYISWKRSM